MTITERVQEVFNKFNVKLTVTEEPRTEMAEAALDNGTVVYTDAEAFAEGVEAYIINDEGEKIPLPPGDYELEDGRTLVIGEGGVVSSIGQPEAEVEEVEASEEVEVEIEAEEEPGYVTKAEVEEMIKAALESIKDKEEMSVNPEAPKEAKEEEEEVVDEVAVELAAVKAQLEDMKKQAAEAGLKHKAPSVKREPLNLKNLSTQERVSALLNQFSNQ
jgi:hypothetical protein